MILCIMYIEIPCEFRVVYTNTSTIIGYFFDPFKSASAGIKSCTIAFKSPGIGTLSLFTRGIFFFSIEILTFTLSSHVNTLLESF